MFRCTRNCVNSYCVMEKSKDFQKNVCFFAAVDGMESEYVRVPITCNAFLILSVKCF